MRIKTAPLRGILGLRFGLVLLFGTMVGVGILRRPATVAAALGTPTLIMIAWVLGAVFTLMGALSISKLAAMTPKRWVSDLCAALFRHAKRRTVRSAIHSLRQ